MIINDKDELFSQEQPCVFQILSQYPPLPPEACRVADITHSHFQVLNSGLKQVFFCMVRETPNSEPLANINYFTSTYCGLGLAHSIQGGSFIRSLLSAQVLCSGPVERGDNSSLKILVSVSASGEKVFSQQSRASSFLVRDLVPSTTYSLSLWAVNSLGTSQPSYLR